MNVNIYNMAFHAERRFGPFVRKARKPLILIYAGWIPHDLAKY